jgi:hypothetical protein
MSREPLATVAFLEKGGTAVLLLLFSAVLSDPSTAQSTGLDGTWSGSGSVSFAAGGKETARCRLQYSRTSSGSYLLSGICATTSGRASQTATLQRVGANTYRGRFYNSEYAVSGTIDVTVSGNRQTARLTSERGSASIELRR